MFLFPLSSHLPSPPPPLLSSPIIIPSFIPSYFFSSLLLSSPLLQLLVALVCLLLVGRARHIPLNDRHDLLLSCARPRCFPTRLLVFYRKKVCLAASLSRAHNSASTALVIHCRRLSESDLDLGLEEEPVTDISHRYWIFLPFIVDHTIETSCATSTFIVQDEWWIRPTATLRSEPHGTTAQLAHLEPIEQGRCAFKPAAGACNSKLIILDRSRLATRHMMSHLSTTMLPRVSSGKVANPLLQPRVLRTMPHTTQRAVSSQLDEHP